MTGPLSRARVRPAIVAVAAVALVAVVVWSVGTRRRRAKHADGVVVETTGGTLRVAAPGIDVRVASGPAGGEEVLLRSIAGRAGPVLEGAVLGARLGGAPATIVATGPARPSVRGPAHAVVPVRIEAGAARVDAEIRWKADRDPPRIAVTLHETGGGGGASMALTMAADVGDRRAFVPGTGALADWGDARGRWIVLEAGARSCAIVAPGDEASAQTRPAPHAEAGSARLVVRTADASPGATPTLVVVPAESGAAAAAAAMRAVGAPARTVRGRVANAGPGTRVWAASPDGRPLVRGDPGPDGRFEIVAPASDVGLYATAADVGASPTVSRAAGDDAPVELVLLAGGELRVRVRDADTGEPLTARIIVRGAPPTPDPSFGPDYRASGAGPLMDVLRGRTSTPLPAGRYRVQATRGPEYTVDDRVVEVAPGGTAEADLALRRVVDTPGLVGCDFHVHARPSFDAPVLPEDRVLSLVAAGVDFAVPSEHNIVGDYAPALEAQGLAADLATVRGVEVTTYDPKFGHFNVFPWDGDEPPAYQRTTPARVFDQARAGDPRRVLQVNHPRLGNGIGYFEMVRLDPKTHRPGKPWRDDFDTLEVYNGFDAHDRPRVEAVLREWLSLLEAGKRYVATGDSDSHRIQYTWAGYPRTYVALPLERAGDAGQPVDGVALVAALKAGRAVVTSGPLVEARVEGAGPGDAVRAAGGTVRVHVRVRAAPWIDVTEVEARLGTAASARTEVPSRPARTGPPAGDLAAARAEAVRWEGDLEVPVGPRGGPLVVIARGERTLEDVLPFVPYQPLAFTNPIWVRRD